MVYNLFENCGDADLIGFLLLLKSIRRFLAKRETLGPEPFSCFHLGVICNFGTTQQYGNAFFCSIWKPRAGRICNSCGLIFFTVCVSGTEVTIPISLYSKIFVPGFQVLYFDCLCLKAGFNFTECTDSAN